MRIDSPAAVPRIKQAKPARYFDNLNRPLADLIPSRARRILEVGCAEGRLGAWLKEQEPRRVVYGIEFEPEIAVLAAENLDHVLPGDVEAMLPLPYDPGSFDCVTFGDVLEHLRDPAAVLRAAKEVLCEDGVICACVPNVAHWSVVASLLDGRFTYEDNGLLDRTHVHFFTPRSFREMLDACGYEVVEERDIAVPNPAVTAVLGQAAAALGLDAAAAEAAAITYQRLFKARPRRVTPVREDATFEENLAQTGTSVVVLTYNSQATFVECLKSVLGTLGPADELIVVDNGSTDGTAELLAGIDASSPQFRVILNGANLGFSAGCNVGIRAARGAFVTLLNPDTIVTPGWIERMRAHFADERIGAVGPTSDHVGGDQKYGFHLPEGTTGEYSVDGMAALLAEANRGEAFETKLLIGFCLMLSRKALDRVGLLDESLFLGADDFDLSWRLREAGYRLVVARDAFVHHACHVSFATNSEAERLNAESVDAFARKLLAHYGPGRVPSSGELFGMDWFRPTVDLWGSAS